MPHPVAPPPDDYRVRLQPFDPCVCLSPIRGMGQPIDARRPSRYIAKMVRKLRVGIVGATGMVGQRFVTLLADHPWFEVVTVAASERSAGRSYADAVSARWAMGTPVPAGIGGMVVKNAARVEEVAAGVDFIFCAVDMPKDETRRLEDAYAKAETPVVSNNSAHRLTPDVPMILP
jgi:aspartate-semialdehyde dehydrogenase